MLAGLRGRSLGLTPVTGGHGGGCHRAPMDSIGRRKGVTETGEGEQSSGCWWSH